MKEYLSDVSAVLAEQQTTADGLTADETARRLAQHGPNKLKESKKVSLIRRFFGVDLLRS